MSRDTAMDLTILEIEKLFRDNNTPTGVLKDPNWPGPKYYSECKKFSWKEVLVKNHQAYYVKKGLTYPDYKAI